MSIFSLWVLVSVYFVGGLLFMKFVKKAEGTDLIPNYNIWIGLIGNFKVMILMDLIVALFTT